MSLPALIDNVTKELMAMPQSSCNVVHYFAPGICVREVTMPAGTFAVGHRQKFDHLNVFLKGRVRMFDELTGETSEISAPLIYVGKPGRKVGYIMEDMVWQNIYATDLTDPDAVEDHFIDKQHGFAEYADLHRPEHNDGDYEQMLADVGYTAEQVEKESQIDSDIMPFPFGAVSVQIGLSKIHGKGLFATSDMKAGHMIPARINGNRTPAGRYVNHAKTPNCAPILIHGDIYFMLKNDVNGNRGGLLGDELTVDYREVYRIAR